LTTQSARGKRTLLRTGEDRAPARAISCCFVAKGDKARARKELEPVSHARNGHRIDGHQAKWITVYWPDPNTAAFFA
jgi:hypothetical protein